MKGLLFDIEEFCLFDGPGIRTGIFFKGCPLRCSWCHNPEGLASKPEIVRNLNGCDHCNRCIEVCPCPESCSQCMACVEACPNHLIRISGKWMESSEIAEEVNKNRDILNYSGGGVTLSGGEVLFQAEFAIELLHYLKGLHRAIETSGFAEGTVFMQVIKQCELVIMDIKITDPATHIYHTGVSNTRILENYYRLRNSGIPHIIRVPLIPGVTDTEENIDSICRIVDGDPDLQRLELLVYNPLAHAKYPMTGRKFEPKYDPHAQPALREEIINKYAISYEVLM